MFKERLTWANPHTPHTQDFEGSIFISGINSSMVDSISCDETKLPLDYAIDILRFVTVLFTLYGESKLVRSSFIFVLLS